MKAIIFTISLAVLAMTGCSQDSGESKVEEEKPYEVRYLPDDETDSLKIDKLSGEELIELAGRREITPQNRASILDRLKAFPGNSTVLAVIPFIDSRDMIQMEVLKTSGDKDEWELTEIKLGKVAIFTLRTVTGENISNPEGWLAWYQDHKDKLADSGI
jgi:hypothetical protein